MTNTNIFFHIGGASSYPYAVEGIQWPESAGNLPIEAEVDLPTSLVLADHSDDEEWDEAITDALTAKFGVRPVEFGSFQPAD